VRRSNTEIFRAFVELHAAKSLLPEGQGPREIDGNT
jgi:hypothetical protein